MQITTTGQDNLIRWSLAAGAYFLCLIAFYIDIGQDMGAKYFMPVLVPVIAALILMQYGSRIPLFSKAALPNLLTGLLWCSAFPLLYTWTYNQGWYMSMICFDFLIGTALFVVLTSLESALFRLGWHRTIAVIMSLLNFVGIVVPLIQYIYYCTVWHCLSPASLMALYLTNYRESLDYIQSNIGVLPALGILAALLAFLYFCYKCHLRLANELEEDTTAGRMGALAFLVIFAMWTLSVYLPQSSIASLWFDVDTYVKQTQEYGLGHDERLNSLSIDQSMTLAAKAPGTVIFVIGESASRNYMKAYTPDFPYEDTPWLSSMAENDNFLIFHHAYASWSQTVPVLQRALTEQSQYNGKEFFNSSSIIDVAKKAGYETWWFSNQGRYGQYDSAITLVAKTADHAEWTDDSYNFTDKYDEALLPYLSQLDPTKNNFVVLHVMGSHIYYNNRYPSAFSKFKTAEGESTVTSKESYANSILYTDYILSQVFAYAQKNLNLQAMVYFSDHGENLEISHNPDVFSFDMVRIPMFIYLSPAYQQALPGRTRALREHREEYFTNDMLYDTISGLLNAPSDRYEPYQDFASRSYAYNRENLTTMLGQRKLTEDMTDMPPAPPVPTP